MPDPKAHTEQRNHNFQLNGELQKLASFSDWQVTVIFYAAVHSVEAHLAKSFIDSGNHLQRKQNIRNDRVLRRIASKYSSMYDLSRSARYDCVPITKSDVNNQLQWLQQIETHIKNSP